MASRDDTVCASAAARVGDACETFTGVKNFRAWMRACDGVGSEARSRLSPWPLHDAETSGTST